MTGPLILPFNGKVPRIHKTAYIAPNATIIGDVVIGAHASVFYNVVLRGDLNRITIGDRTNIQDNCVLHVDADAPCTLGDDVTVGHLALVHGATVGNGVLVGMKANLLSHSVVGAGSLIAAGAAAGVPGKVRRQLSDEQSAGFIPHAARYVQTAAGQASISEALSLAEVQFE